MALLARAVTAGTGIAPTVNLGPYHLAAEQARFRDVVLLLAHAEHHVVGVGLVLLEIVRFHDLPFVVPSERC